jgi:hypothetical protein
MIKDIGVALFIGVPVLVAILAVWFLALKIVTGTL